MALYNPQQAARATLASLRYLTLLPRTVRQDFSADSSQASARRSTSSVLFSAGKAKVYTAANRAARDAIHVQRAHQNWVPVTLENQVYNAVRLPDNFGTFTLKDLTTQVLIPQAVSVVDELATRSSRR